MKNDRLLSYTEAAEILRLAPCTLRAWVSKGRITHVKLSKKVFFRPADLEKFLDDCVVEARPKERCRE